MNQNQKKKKPHGEFNLLVVRNVRYPGWSGDTQTRVDIQSDGAVKADVHLSVEPGHGLASALKQGKRLKITVA